MPWKKPFTPPHNQRLEPDLYEQAHRITFITIRAYQHATPFTKENLNKMIIDTILEEQERLQCLVFVYCLMPDHLHYLIGPKHDGISVLSYTNQFKGKTTRRSWKYGWEGKLWQPRFFDHIVRKDEDLRNITTYILNNPVRKEFVNHASEWQWSGSFAELPL